MSKVRAVLLAVLATVGMAACSSAFAGIQWQGSMDDARRNAGAFMVSPQGKVSGLVYSLDPVANGWKLNRSGTALQQQPFPLTQGAYAPLRPASQYGITGNPSKAAVIDVPASVKVPGKSSTVPVRIIEPIAKPTLARMATKALKALPVVGNAYALGELLEEVGLAFQDNQFLQLEQQDPSQYQVSTGIGYWISNSPNTLSPTREIACTVWTQSLGYTFTSLYLSPTNGNYYCKYNRPGYVNQYQLVTTYGPYAACPSGYYIMQDGSCVDSLPLRSTPITESQAVSTLESLATNEQLVEAVNDLPNDPNVIDVIARELQDDPADEEIRWPSTSPAIAPSTFLIGDPLVTTTTNPDGSTVTQTTTTTATTSGDTVTFNTTTVTNTYNQSGQLTGTTTTTTTPTDPSNPNSPQQEDLECGLPGKPPCKIDEAGTPEPPVNDAEQTVRDLFSEWQACIDDIQACLPQLPDISWTFSLPSGCSPIPLPGFERWGLSAVDICPYQPMIHNLMSMLWAAAGLFGAISIISRRRTSE